MNLINGINYNIKGVILALKTPKLLWLGILRFVVVLFLTLLLSSLVLYWQDDILNMIWKTPESGWLIYIWKAVSWILSIFLAAISMVIAYLISQVLFCVFIMDYMSRITEEIVLGKTDEFQPDSWLSFFIYLIKQEIPRAIIPILITFVIMIVGLLTPLGPVILILSSIAAAVFLAWDNTDLTPARQMIPFKTRFGYLKKNILFHIGFGLLFLIPWLNIVFLSFAPVGATLYYLDKEK
ncbi:MAG: hypothetical protein GY699_00660 [Desulfobacteraceae bacterium]|nr:hypothetical protein [Desulfobacteraceae bacterium]